MFESDDFDQVLSQLDFPEMSAKIQSGDTKENTNNRQEISHNSLINSLPPPVSPKTTCILSKNSLKPISKICGKEVQSPQERAFSNSTKVPCIVSPKHTKRKIINSHFDHKSKRKFPGPAGLLTGTLEENNDENICQMELLSQDLDFTQNQLRRDLFESPLWMRLLEDVRSWNLCDVDPIKTIKQQALAGNLRRRKAQIVTAFVETIDRSATDPLVILRDSTGNIKGTLHRDVWSTFSSYIVSEYCALVLWKPTVLTTGSAFKKHYLNITLSNIYAIYSSSVLKDEEISLPDGYTRISDEDFTVIKIEMTPQNFGSIIVPSNEQMCNESNDFLEGLDNIFSDDIF